MPRSDQSRRSKQSRHPTRRRTITGAQALAKVRRICLALPDTYEKEAWGAPTFRRGKMFLMFVDDHHGDGRLAIDKRPCRRAVDAHRNEHVTELPDLHARCDVVERFGRDAREGVDRIGLRRRRRTAQGLGAFEISRDFVHLNSPG